jgi:hypothetical protein
MSYIADSDITDKLALQFESSFSTYHSLVDNQINDIAEQLGITNSDDIDTDDDGYISSWYVKQYAVMWFCQRLFLDKMGMNNIDLAQEEKYRVKHEYYFKQAENKEKYITLEMLTNNVDESGDRSSQSHLLYRT